MNGTIVWELGGGNYGATPNASGGAGPGAPLSGFANLVEGTLGPGPGALSVISLANPNGYLNLDQQAIQSATPAGNGSVDGTPVTYYDVTIDVAKLADAANLTDQQRLTIQDALQVLQAQGYTGTKATVGVDAAGFIRDITSTTRFADGSTLHPRHPLLELRMRSDGFAAQPTRFAHHHERAVLVPRHAPEPTDIDLHVSSKHDHHLRPLDDDDDRATSNHNRALAGHVPTPMLGPLPGTSPKPACAVRTRVPWLRPRLFRSRLEC